MHELAHTQRVHGAACGDQMTHNGLPSPLCQSCKTCAVLSSFSCLAPRQSETQKCSAKGIDSVHVQKGLQKGCASWSRCQSPSCQQKLPNDKC
eukprot:5485936-Amphidinium_carterae.1